MTDMMTELGYSSKLNGEWGFLRMLRAEGRRAASAFLDTHAEDLGQRSTGDFEFAACGMPSDGPSRILIAPGKPNPAVGELVAAELPAAVKVQIEDRRVSRSRRASR